MKHLLFYAMSLIIGLSACSSKTDALAPLRKKAEKSICDDVRSITHSSIDAMSMGLGSMVISSVMSESKQDSILMKPFLPMIRKDLKTLKKPELENIISSKKARYKFIGTTLLNNKEAMTSSLKKSYEFAAPLVDKAIEFVQSQAAQIQ
jgi:hypothetical protein